MLQIRLVVSISCKQKCQKGPLHNYTYLGEYRKVYLVGTIRVCRVCLVI